MVDPSDVLRLAEWLKRLDLTVVQLEPEAIARTCASRAYYAAFLLARDAAGIDSNSASVHQTVVDHYFHRGSRVGQLLKEARRLRNLSDYDVGVGVDARDAGRAITLAQQVFAAVRRMQHRSG